MKHTTGRGPKNKGKAFEREIVASILAAFPQLSPHDVLARSSGDPGVDIILSEAARKVLPLAIECKRVGRVEDLDLKGAMEQAEAYREPCTQRCPDITPCVVYREDRHAAIAVLSFEDLAWLLDSNIRIPPSCLISLSWVELLKFFGGFKG